MKELTVDDIWKRYNEGLLFNTNIDLDEEVQNNENFFIGKQWEGVVSNGLPTPVFNFLKRVTLFTVASVTTDNLKLQCQPLGNSGAKGEFYRLVKIVNNQFDAIFEYNKIGDIIREEMRNAAVDGDGCTHTYWDNDIETGQENKGGIVTEIVENTRVFFGNPNDRKVQKQPWIIIEKRELLDEVKDRAKENGVEDWDSITPDNSGRRENKSEQLTNNRVTVLMHYYRNKETKTIWCMECTRNFLINHVDTGLSLYPITWLNWDYRQDNYHGQALISGLIPNQIFVNRAYAMTMISLMATAYPKIIYDKTRVKAWSNQVGAQIAVNGGDVNNVAKILDPATISPQVSQFIQQAINDTQTFLGATPAALGDTRPDNTSAIIALQRASATPNELTKQNLYSSIEDLGRIYVDFMANYYGTRVVEMTVPKEISDELQQLSSLKPGEEVSGTFDFSTLKKHPLMMKLDVGASAYWSEIASMQTLDNLLMQGKIELQDYLERIPDGYISQRQELLDKIRQVKADQEKAQEQMEQASNANVVDAPKGGSALKSLLDNGEPIPLPTGGGYSELQRSINKTGVAK